MIFTSELTQDQLLFIHYPLCWFSAFSTFVWPAGRTSPSPNPRKLGPRAACIPVRPAGGISVLCIRTLVRPAGQRFFFFLTNEWFILLTVGETVLVHVDFRRVPVQVGALHAERIGHLFGTDADCDEHRTVSDSGLIMFSAESADGDVVVRCSYYAIVHPIRAQYLCTLSQARKVITATWTFSFVLASPTLFIQVSTPCPTWSSPYQLQPVHTLIVIELISWSFFFFT